MLHAMNLQHITKRFGDNVAVDDVTLELRGGEILAVVGENGAGKTTLMRIASGELAPDGGSVWGVDVSSARDHQSGRDVRSPLPDH